MFRALGAPQQNEGGGANSGCAGDFVDVKHFRNVQASRLTTDDVKMFCELMGNFDLGQQRNNLWVLKTVEKKSTDHEIRNLKHES